MIDMTLRPRTALDSRTSATLTLVTFCPFFGPPPSLAFDLGQVLGGEERSTLVSCGVVRVPLVDVAGWRRAMLKGNVVQLDLRFKVFEILGFLRFYVWCFLGFGLEDWGVRYSQAARITTGAKVPKTFWPHGEAIVGSGISSDTGIWPGPLWSQKKKKEGGRRGGKKEKKTNDKK